MTEEAGRAGLSTAALVASSAALRARGNALAGADRSLQAVVADAHTTSAIARGRLDAVASEVNDFIEEQDRWALDTPIGARAAQQMLAAKLREIEGVVKAAVNDAAGQQKVLAELLALYAP